MGGREYAWGQDELRPLSRTGSKWINLGLTLADGLDMLLLAGLEPEFKEVRHCMLGLHSPSSSWFVNLILQP